MAEKRLVEYIKTYMKQGYSENQLKEHLAKAGWDAKDLSDAFREIKPDKASPKPHLESIVGRENVNSSRLPIMPIVAIVVIFLIIGVIFYGYFGVLSPKLVEKTFVEKPAPPVVGQAINTKQLEYVFNEAGGYKLHKIPFTKVKS
ncbi:MAG: hypothetical protein ABII01_03265 [Candidatus Woesearchaeota archaeon]